MKGIIVSFAEGEKRIVTKFLWLPVECNGEVRWLETTTMEQEYQYTEFNYQAGFAWETIRFIDN